MHTSILSGSGGLLTPPTTAYILSSSTSQPRINLLIKRKVYIGVFPYVDREDYARRRGTSNTETS